MRISVLVEASMVLVTLIVCSQLVAIGGILARMLGQIDRCCCLDGQPEGRYCATNAAHG
jgi:hypothetical protein